MAQFIKALYDEKEPCYINLDFIVDVFPHGRDKWIAYTFDDDRQGYVITDKDFKDAIERDNKIHVESEDKE